MSDEKKLESGFVKDLDNSVVESTEPEEFFDEGMGFRAGAASILSAVSDAVAGGNLSGLIEQDRRSKAEQTFEEALSTALKDDPNIDPHTVYSKGLSAEQRRLSIDKVSTKFTKQLALDTTESARLGVGVGLLKHKSLAELQQDQAFATQFGDFNLERSSKQAQEQAVLLSNLQKQIDIVQDLGPEGLERPTDPDNPLTAVFDAVLGTQEISALQTVKDAETARRNAVTNQEIVEANARLNRGRFELATLRFGLELDKLELEPAEQARIVREQADKTEENTKKARIIIDNKDKQQVYRDMVGILHSIESDLTKSLASLQAVKESQVLKGINRNDPVQLAKAQAKIAGMQKEFRAAIQTSAKEQFLATTSIINYDAELTQRILDGETRLTQDDLDEIEAGKIKKTPGTGTGTGNTAVIKHLIQETTATSADSTIQETSADSTSLGFTAAQKKFLEIKIPRARTSLEGIRKKALEPGDE